MQRRARTGASPVVHPPSVVVEGARLGADVVVGAFCFVARGAVVGAGTRIQSHTSVWDGVVLGEDVFVGPGAQFTNVRHPRAAASGAASDWDRTFVEDHATIGAQATLVAPVRVGHHAVVGAGAVGHPRRRGARRRRRKPRAPPRMGLRVRRGRVAGRRAPRGARMCRVRAGLRPIALTTASPARTPSRPRTPSSSPRAGRCSRCPSGGSSA